MVGLTVVEQLCSRICHDLAGPIGAIRNGLELIEDMAGVEEGAGADAEGGQALDLIGHSVERAARRLRLFRFAYGVSPRDGFSNFDEQRDAALSWMADGRVDLYWQPGQPADVLGARPGLAKLLLNLVILATEALPQGGSVTVDGGGTLTAGWVSVTAGGGKLKWSAETAAALTGTGSGDVPGLQVVQAAITGRFASLYRFGLGCEEPAPQALALRLSW
ncbi:MAG: histidine phosphotransferase family protein [Rhodospirillaceae bacterium]